MAAAAPIIASATVKGAIARMALSVAASFVINKLFAPDVPNQSGGNFPSIPDQGVQQRLSTNTENKLPVVYGESRVFGSIWFADISADNQTMAFIIPLCEGPIEAINDIYWDDWRLTLDGNGNVTQATDRDGETDDFLNGNLKIIKYTNGGRCTNMENFSSKWNTNSANRQLPNMAYLYAELNYDRDKSVTGLTNKLGAEVLGKKVRTITNATTINNTLSYSNNPAECTLDYLTNSTYGCGNIITDDEIDIESFYNHKVWCNDVLDYTDNQGATQTAKRFTTNGFVNTNETRDIAISDLTMNSQSTLSYSLGKFQMISDKVSSSVMTFDETNTYGDVAINNDGFNSTLNKIEVTYNSKLNLYQGDQVFIDLPDSAKAPFEPELIKNLKAKFNNNAVEVKRWATANMNKSRNNLTVSFQTDLRALALQVGDVITVKNETYGFDAAGKLFRITAISETLIDSLPGFVIAAREYADADYADLVLAEEDTAANTSLPNPRKFGLITDLTSNANEPNGTTPYIDLTWTIPTGLIEEFELFMSEGLTGDKISLPNVTISTGTFTAGNTFTHRLLNVEHTNEDLYFYVKPINQFAKGSLSNSYNFGPFTGSAGGEVLALSNGIFTDTNNDQFPFATQNKFCQVVYGDDENGSGIRKNPGLTNSTYNANYTGTNVEVVTRTGGTTTSGTVTFDAGFSSVAGTNQIEEIELVDGYANILSDSELAHIAFANNEPNNTALETVTNVKSYGLSGYINTGTNSAKVNDDIELYSLLGTTPSGFGNAAVIGDKTAYVNDGTNVYSFFEANGSWSYNATIADSDTMLMDPNGTNLLTYNQSNSTAKLYNVALLQLRSLSNIDVTTGHIIDFNNNILAWYNGTDIKIAKIDINDPNIDYIRSIKTIANVRTIKIKDNYTIEYTTDTEVHSIAYDESNELNTYNLNVNNITLGTTPSSVSYFPIDGEIINSFGSQIIIRGSDSNVDLSGFGTSGTLAIIPENDYSQYGAQAVSYTNAPSRVTSSSIVNTNIVIEGRTLNPITAGVDATEVVIEQLKYDYGDADNDGYADIPTIPATGEVMLNNDGVWRSYDTTTNQSTLLPVTQGGPIRSYSSGGGGQSLYPALWIKGDYVFQNINFGGATYDKFVPIKIRATSAPINVEPNDIIITIDTNSGYEWNIGDQAVAVYTTPTSEDATTTFVHSFDYAIEAKFTNISSQPTQSWKVKSINNSKYYKNNNTFAYTHTNAPYGTFNILTGAVIGEDKLSTDLVADLFNGNMHVGSSSYYHSGVARSFLSNENVEIMTLELADGTEQVITGDITYTINVLSRSEGEITPNRGLGQLKYKLGTSIADHVRVIGAKINELPGHEVFEINPSNTTIKYSYNNNEAEVQLDVDAGAYNTFTSYSGNNPWTDTTHIGGLTPANNNSNFHRTSEDTFLVDNGTDTKSYKWDTGIVATAPTTVIQDASGTDLVIEVDTSSWVFPNSVGNPEGRYVTFKRADGNYISGITGSSSGNTRLANAAQFLINKGIGIDYSYYYAPTPTLTEAQGGKYILFNNNEEPGFIYEMASTVGNSSGVTKVTVKLMSQSGSGSYKEGLYTAVDGVQLRRVDAAVTDVTGQTRIFGDLDGDNAQLVLNYSGTNSTISYAGIERADGGAIQFDGYNTGSLQDKTDAAFDFARRVKSRQMKLTGNGLTDAYAFFLNESAGTTDMPGTYQSQAYSDNYGNARTGAIKVNGSGQITGIWIRVSNISGQTNATHGNTYNINSMYTGHSIAGGGGLLPPAYNEDVTFTGTGGIKGYLNNFFVGNNHYSYTRDKVTLQKLFDPTGKNYSLTIGTNVIAANENFTSTNNYDALKEIATKIRNETSYEVSLPYLVSKIDSTQTNANAIGGYQIDIDLGATDQASPFTFSVSSTNADEYNTSITDDAMTASQATLTYPDGTTTVQFNLSSSNNGDFKADELGQQIADHVNNTLQSPEDYTAVYDTNDKVITFTGTNPFNYDANNLFNLTITHNGNGTLSNENTTVDTEGVDNSNFSINATIPSYLPNLTLNNQNKINYSADGINANTAASEFASAFNTFVGANGTASAASNVVTFSINIQEDLGLTLDFSDSNITSSITQGSLGATIDANTGSNLQVTKPDGTVENYKYFYLNPTVTGAIANVGDIITSLNNSITDYTITDNTGSITITAGDNTNRTNQFGFVWTHDPAVTTPLSFDSNTTFATDSNFGNELNTISGSSYPSYYGIRSPFSSEDHTVFPTTASSYKWFNIDSKIDETTGEINPQYRIQTASRPQFRFDRNAQSDNFANINTDNNGVIAPNLIDTDILTVQTVYGKEVIEPENDPLEGAQLTFWKGRYYLALAVDDAIYNSININNQEGEAIFTLEALTNYPGEFYNYDTNTQQLVQSNNSDARKVYVFNATLNAFVEIYE